MADGVDLVARGVARTAIDWSAPSEELTALVKALSAELDDDPVSLNRIDGVRQTVEPVVLCDSEASLDDLDVIRRAAPFAGTVTERVFRKRAAVLETYVDGADPEDLPRAWRAHAARFGPHGLIGAPVIVDDVVVGSVVVGRRREQACDEATLLRVVECAERIARALAGEPAASAAAVALDRPSPWQAVCDIVVGIALPLAFTLLISQASRVQDYRPSAVLLVTVLAATTIRGVRSGIVAAATATLCAWWAFIGPPGLHVRAWHDITGSVVFAAGAVLTLVLAARVMAARRAEATARWFGDTLIDRAPFGIALYDRALRFRRVNKKLEEINRRPAEAHLGKRPGELSAIAGDAYEPILAAVLRTGIAIEDRDVSVDLPGGLERHFRASFYPIADDRGALFGAGAVVEEVTATVIARRRNERLTSLAQTLTGATTREEVIRAVYAFVREEWRARCSFATVRYDRHGVVVSALMEGYDDGVAEGWRERLIDWDADTPFVEAARTTSMIESESLAAFEARYPESTTAALLTTGDESCVWVPVIDPSDAARALAVIRLGWPYPRRISSEGRALLQTIAAVVALALYRIELTEAAAEQTRSREREAVALLQRVALPPTLPAMRGARFGALYEPAIGDQPLGGDWYDAFALDGHTVALAIADVAGHGPDAATVMVQVRNIMRAMAIEHRRPNEVMARVNGVVRETRVCSGFVTCAFGVLDTDAGTFSWALAGHPPPLLVTPSAAKFLTLTPGPPLGVVDKPTYAVGAVALDRRDRVLLYTDGLIERRRESLSDGMARLRAAARATCGLSPQQAVDAIGGELIGRHDDAAMVCADLVP